MNKILICLILCTFPALLFSQKDYFQQVVNYKIDVTLDDSSHTLAGEISMEYTNKAPETLEQIYVHLWANAYKNRNTAFAKQSLESGSTRFYFSEPKDLGNFSNLNFTVNEEGVGFEYDPQHPDIGIIQLNEPLAPGGKITIHTPFILKIPASFSRLGHVGESYQMTQWFPKPAVYDRQGWHAMPYLDMGEFYSEFGDFEVRITLPANYVVAATGEVQEAAEKAFLEEKIKATNLLMGGEFPAVDTFPASSSEMKTITFLAEEVHDFAWFADKRFHVQKSSVTLNSGREVDSWAFFTNTEAELWKKGTFYVDRSLEFYSQHVGEYPYPQATAVQSALSAGGGMEYPMITVIGLSGNAQALDEVITHEVGHNWFYGILAFDEREHPWMDEGLNSYYDHRYTRQYYEQPLPLLPKVMVRGSDVSTYEIAYLFQARRNIDQPPATSSADFSPVNYYLSAYEKPARIFRMLEVYLGTAEFDRLMKGFYEKWKFKHPMPEDLRSYLEDNSQRNLDWLFDGLIGSAGKIDYALTGIRQDGTLQLTVRNKGDLKTPFSISGMKGKEIIETRWYEGFPGEKVVDFPVGDYDRMVLDAKQEILDVNRQNNNIRTSGIFKTVEPLRLKFATGIEHAQRTSLYWSPLLAYNAYDDVMVGLTLYNSLIPARKFEFALAPLYAFDSGDLTGMGHVRYNIFPKSSKIQRLTIGLSAKSFNYNYIERDDYHLKYRRLVPSLSLQFGQKPGSSVQHTLDARAILLDEELARRDTDGVYLGNEFDNSLIFDLRYTLENRRALNPFKLQLGLEQQSYTNLSGDQHYLKAWLDWQSAYTYNTGRAIDFRIFVGAFLDNSRRNAGATSSRQLARGSWSLVAEGFTDYRYDGLYFGRNEGTGIWSQQINQEQGGLKTAFGSSFGIGESNSFIVSLNMKADLPQDLPLQLPIKPYFDIGYFDNAQPIASDATFTDQLMWSGGLMLDFVDETFAIYFPLINSDNVKTLYNGRDSGNYLARITWTLNLNQLDPWRFVDRLEF
ncbi:MAG: M1 family metallopeptidase [Bacteroidota bacterium]